MSIIEPELHALKENLLDLLKLVINQVDTCKKSITKLDVKLAQEVIDDEKKINAQELAIDKDSANVLALHTPVAVDLRFVLSTLRISNDLKRIGDNIKSIGKFVKQNHEDLTKTLTDEFKLKKMLEILIAMLEEMKLSLKDDNSSLAKKTLKKDGSLNQLNKKALKTAEAIIKKQPSDAKVILGLFSVVRSLERCGNLTKNIGEEIVFHLEAEVLRYKKESKN